MLTKINLIKSFSGYLPFRFQFLFFFSCRLITGGSNHQAEGRNSGLFFYIVISFASLFFVSFLFFFLHFKSISVFQMSICASILSPIHTVVTRIKIKYLFEANIKKRKKKSSVFLCVIKCVRDCIPNHAMAVHINKAFVIKYSFIY